MPQQTLLSTIINRMKRRQSLNRSQDQDLVRDLDESLRTLRRDYQLPWNLKKGSLKVFNGVYEYPVFADYDELAYLDSSKDEGYYPARARFRFTSLQQFYENLDYRNDLAEIRDANSVFLGVRYQPNDSSSQLLNGAEDIDDWSVSDDATAVVADTVNFRNGNGAVRVSITNSTGTATIKNNFTTSLVDSHYKRKYHFKWIYLDAVPTSITLRFQVDDSNYLQTTGITTQFSGQPLVADAWNLIAHDLNTATEVGTVSTASTWASEKVILTGAATGTYYVDNSNLRQWELLDCWYYSKYNVMLVGATVANQEYFMDSSEVYSTDSSLVGDSEWADLIMYDAMMIALADNKESGDFNFAKARYDQAVEALERNYPSMKPLIITSRYRFQDDHTQPMSGTLN